MTREGQTSIDELLELVHEQRQRIDRLEVRLAEANEERPPSRLKRRSGNSVPYQGGRMSRAGMLKAAVAGLAGGMVLKPADTLASGGFGIEGSSKSGIGVEGMSQTGVGVEGQTGSKDSPAVYGHNTGKGSGVKGISVEGAGGHFEGLGKGDETEEAGAGVYAVSQNNIGIVAISRGSDPTKGVAVYAVAEGAGAAISGFSYHGVGGNFKGDRAQIHLELGHYPVPLADGQLGDMYADSHGRLWWFGRNLLGTPSWKQLA